MMMSDSSIEPVEPAEVDEGASDETVAQIGADQSTEGVETVSPNAVASTIELTPKSEQSDEGLKSLNQLMLDLRWLITEGYVTEYGDGHLFAPPPMPEPKSDLKSEIKD